MTPAEVAAMLFVDPKTVTRWARAGKLDAIRTPGGHRRYRRSDVLDIMSGTYRSQGLPEPRSPEAPVTASGEHDAEAAAVVAEATATALEAEAELAAETVLVTAAAVAAAAEKAAGAAARARTARAYAAEQAGPTFRKHAPPSAAPGP